jgi:FixJ family two-component response regulator
MAGLVTVVDDDVAVREALQSLIRSAGLSVRVFASAEQFLESSDVGKTACLISDVRMSGMSGTELHRHLLSKGYKVPVIFITAHASDQETKAQALSEGALAYLIKPFEEDELLDAVYTALGSTQSEG